MPDTKRQSPKTYVRGYEVHDVSPLPHYFEEIYGHTLGISLIGPRGDSNYFWYSKDKNGAAYYEVNEQAESAKSTYNFLTHVRNQKKYLKGIKNTISDIQRWIRFIEAKDLSSLGAKELFELNRKSWMLDAQVFSYYLISQPYRLQLFEDQVRQELKKRVASTRVDLYLAKLTASEEITQNADEELNWARLILKTKQGVPGELNRANLETTHQATKQAVQRHYEKYKTLTLGDGNWTFDPDSELVRFVEDFKKPIVQFEERVKKINNFSSEILAERKKLIEELYIDKKTQKVISFLSHMSHVRYTMRVEGFIPLIYVTIQILDVLAPRLGFEIKGGFAFLTHEELEKSQNLNESCVSQDEINRRRGLHDEYMLRINEGRIEYIYGKEAGDLFKKLVPPEDHSKSTEVKGVSAEHGLVKNSVTVYNWGDSIAEAMKNIRKHPILVAGQTRPAMMPIIREAKGIITDEGGVTSHAAIVARELKIPAIINTHNGTKVFKTGDKIVLDADKGIARKT